MNKIFKDFIYEEKGQGMTEYIFLIVVIVLIAIVAYRKLGAKVAAKTDQTTNELG
jgi:Flp pilus assembly pilin Flp